MCVPIWALKIHQKTRRSTTNQRSIAVRYQVLNLFRGFSDHLYKLDIVVPGIECAMAYLLQFQAITAADIWVFTRVVEDAMLFVLVRWREQSKLETCSNNRLITVFCEYIRT
jgi:hypothetical protein